jgi:hypothetical protein
MMYFHIYRTISGKNSKIIASSTNKMDDSDNVLTAWTPQLRSPMGKNVNQAPDFRTLNPVLSSALASGEKSFQLDVLWTQQSHIRSLKSIKAPTKWPSANKVVLAAVPRATATTFELGRMISGTDWFSMRSGR